MQGETDSERLFAYLLSAIDEAEADHPLAIDRALVNSVRPIIERVSLGAANFLLSNGRVLYAFRRGRALQMLDRREGDRVRVIRTSRETEATVETPWTARRHAVLVSSERLTNEPFREIAEGTLLRIDSRSDPRVQVLLQQEEPSVSSLP
ncbi:MAG: hypothetical protein NVSMB1_19690 [Polyangiales bacterium]